MRYTTPILVGAINIEVPERRIDIMAATENVDTVICRLCGYTETMNAHRKRPIDRATLHNITVHRDGLMISDRRFVNVPKRNIQRVIVAERAAETAYTIREEADSQTSVGT